MTEISHKTTLTLTANQRLSRKLRRDDEEDQKQHGHQVWETPAIFPLNTWLERCYRTLETDRILLSAANELILFETIIEASADDFPLLPISSTAQLAREAYTLWHRYQLKRCDFEAPYSLEVSQFLKWSKQFQTETQKRGCITHAELPAFLIPYLTQLDLPETIRFVGFDDLPPALMQFIQALRTHAIVEMESSTPTYTAQAVQCTAPHAETEYAMMAGWVRTQLDTCHHTRIGIVTPDLSSNRGDLVAALETALTPEQYQTVNMATGEPFLQLPLIKTALSLLNLQANRIPYDTLSELLRSPFIHAPGSEAAAAAILDLHLAKREQAIFTTLDIQHCCETIASDFSADFLARFEKGLATMGPHRKQKPSEWMARFTQQLEAFGFPGKRALTADERALLLHFEELLCSINPLDTLLGSITRTQALQALKTTCKQASFQPTVAAARVQVLGILEATGWQFDALWLFQFNNQNWPRPARPNPFLPIALQKKYDLPHASAEREHAFGQKITARLLQAAPHIVVSFAAEAQEQPCTISALLRHLPMMQSCVIPASPLKRTLGSARITWEETNGPAWQSTEPLHGGSALFTDQAICPFLSFATYRLNAEPWPIAEPLLNAKLQGILVHAALEAFWEHLQDQATLHAQTEEALNGLLQTIAKDVVKKNRHHFKQHFLQQLEEQRLITLLTAWIAVEKERPFFKVISKEKKLRFDFCGLSLTLRTDRIDELSDGSHVIIDYKTGQPQPIAEWFSERLTAPQLPLYLQAAGGLVRALAYAEVRHASLKWKGVGERGDVLPGVIPIEKMLPTVSVNQAWPTAVETWKQQLEGLAAEFKQGFAAVQPVDESVCQHCEIKMICRIREP